MSNKKTKNEIMCGRCDTNPAVVKIAFGDIEKMTDMEGDVLKQTTEYHTWIYRCFECIEMEELEENDSDTDEDDSDEDEENDGGVDLNN